MDKLKVLFIGTYREVSGWGDAANKYIMALDHVGVDVIPRVIRIRPEWVEPHPRILALENQSSHGCNIVIQNMLPHLMDFNGHFDKNIALFYTETNNLGRSNWVSKLNTMDELWVSSKASVECCAKSNIKKPVEVIPIPCDPDVYTREYPSLELPISDDTFMFYYVGEHSPKKNLQALLIAFHSEFSKNENVCLVLKVGMMGQPDQVVNSVAGQFINDIKGAMRIHDRLDAYLKEILITQRLTDEQLYALHQRGDCFVSPSCGEGWSIPAFDAASFGKPVIMARKVAPQFLTDENAFLIQSHEEPVLYQHAPVRDIYTSYETWERIDIMELRKTMRLAYNNRELSKDKGQEGLKLPEEYSYESVGNLMKDVLLK